MQSAFKKYLEPSHSLESITKEMKLMGIRTRKGKPLCKSQVQRVLTNPFFIGINRFNGKDYPGAQEPIISRKAVQRSMSCTIPHLKVWFAVKTAARLSPGNGRKVAIMVPADAVAQNVRKRDYYATIKSKQAL